MNIVKAVQDWIDPMPPARTAANLEEARNAVMQIDSRFDVSIEWVQSLDGKGGQYVVRPVREDCCATTPSQEPAAATATKQAIQAELRKKLTSISSKAVGASSRLSALISSEGKETEENRQNAIKKLAIFIKRIDDAHAAEPNAPVNREFLTEVFSERAIDDVTEQTHERTRLISGAKPYGSVAGAYRVESANEIQESEVQEIVTLINRVKTEHKSSKNQSSDQSISAAQQRRAFQTALRDRNNTLSKGARELIQAIQQPKRDSQKYSWIDASFENEIPMTLEQALPYVINQFS